MNARLYLIWERVQSSYWFLPGLLLAAGGGGALLMTEIDSKLDQSAIEELAFIFTGGPEGARSVLAAIAASVLGVAGTTFSITIAVLSLTSTQFGPRLLRNFLKDTGNQLVLGTFIGTFLYTLLVLRTVRSVDGLAFVPHLSVTVGLALAVISVCMLVYFIHHVITSIQAARVIATAGNELLSSIEHIYPEKIGTAPSAPPRFTAADAAAAPLRAGGNGYLQAVDGDALLEFTMEHDVVVRLLRMPGEFIAADSVYGLLYPADRLSEELAQRIADVVSLGTEPTALQDVHFSINQLVEIAVRALSPGINDPHTVIMCIDRLGAGLCTLAQREFPAAERLDTQHRLRIIAKTTSFAGVLHTAFAQIRRYGAKDAEVLCRLLAVIGDIAACSRGAERRGALRQQADLVLAAAHDALRADEARAQVTEEHRRTQLVIDREERP